MSASDDVRRDLSSPDLSTRIRGIRSLPNLRDPESVRLIEMIIDTDRSLATRIEALTVLPDVVGLREYDQTCRILGTALRDSDTEIVRNALLAIQRLPRELAPAQLTDQLFQLLEAPDTDLQYHAVLALSRLRGRISSDTLRRRILPLAQHPNATLRETAEATLGRIDAERQ